MTWQKEHELFQEQQVQGYLEMSEESLLNRFEQQHFSDINIILKALSMKCGAPKAANLMAGALEAGTHDKFYLRMHLSGLIKAQESDFEFDLYNGDKNELLEKVKTVFG